MTTLSILDSIVCNFLTNSDEGKEREGEIEGGYTKRRITTLLEKGIPREPSGDSQGCMYTSYQNILEKSTWYPASWKWCFRISSWILEIPRKCKCWKEDGGIAKRRRSQSQKKERYQACKWRLARFGKRLKKSFPWICFWGKSDFLILNGYRKRVVCRKHKVEPGNWSFDPTGALATSLSNSDFLPAFYLNFYTRPACQYLNS